MKTAIITSKKDIAGMNIKESLINLFNFKKLDETFDNNPVYELNDQNPIKNNSISLKSKIFGNLENSKNFQSKNTKKIIKIYTIDGDTIYSEYIDRKIDADLFIFATRHSAKSGLKTLCVHAPGNWGKAEYGGSERKLCAVLPSYIKEAFLVLNEFVENIDYEKTLEATHHGPHLEKPCFFIEIGSSEKEWRDKKAADIIAKTIVRVLEEENKKYKTAIAVGGPHYCETFNKIVLRTDIAIGHICPKYMLSELDEELIKQAIEKTSEKVNFILLDWKGLGKEKQKIIGLLKKLNVEYKRSDKF